MYGHLNNIIKGFITSHFGDDKWETIIKDADCQSEFDEFGLYDENVTPRLIDSTIKVLKLDREAVLVMMGEFYLDHVRSKGHDELLRNLGENMLAFVENLDYVHTYMMGDFPDMNMPSFQCEAQSQADRMTLHYYSFRQGLYPLVMGILKAVAKTYFKSDLVITVTSKELEDVTGQKDDVSREHVIFSLMVTKEKEREHLPPPTFIAQTKKNSEKHILKTDIEHVMERLEEIRREQGEDALPLSKGKTIKAKWRSVAKMSVLYGGFVPQYPPTLNISTKAFCNAFPFHLVFNFNMNVVHAGIKIQQAIPQIRNPSARVDVHFDLLHPGGINFTFSNVKKFINTPFMLRTRVPKVSLVKGTGLKIPLILRGQMVRAEGEDFVIYLCSPFVRSLKDLEARRMYLADIPIHDVTRDLLWMELMIRYRQEHGGRGGSLPHADGGMETDRVNPALLATPPPGIIHTYADAGATEDLRRQIQETESALAEERRKNALMYNAFLPRTTAHQIRLGQKPDAGDYHDTTVLFSDIVSFTQIITCCKPNDVVNLITQLHQKFNRLCQVHNTYRVETIGDAYMVVCGVPDQVLSHADRIANTALGMRIAASDVLSPFDYGDKSTSVKIRIGIHTGQVVAGVIGERVPRFTVMGEAVTLASRMESHGLPGRIHISNVTFECLKNRGFRIEERGEIIIRGKGTQMTYFLEGNENATDSAIMGYKSRGMHHNGVEVTFINEGHEEEPPRSSSTSGSRSPLIPKRNRIYPSDENPTGSRRGSGEGDVVHMLYSDSPATTPSARGRPKSRGLLTPNERQQRPKSAGDSLPITPGLRTANRAKTPVN